MNQPKVSGDSSRREFLATCLHSIAGLAIVGSIAPLVTGCGSNSITGIDSNFQATYDVSSLVSDSTALVTSGNGGDGFPIIIVRQSATSFIALSTQCTHESCQVDPPQGKMIFCSCHGSKFDLSGNVMQGPARTALYKYSTTYDATARTVTVKAA
jgi:cytochrome b6-f complex iron-sulfur subunit